MIFHKAKDNFKNSEETNNKGSAEAYYLNARIDEEEFSS
jgi:hypothetical protein